MDGEDARIVREAEIDQDIERPQRSRDDRVTGGAKADDRAADQVFQQAARAYDVGAKVRRFQLIDEPVCEAVAGDLVAAAHDLGHQMWPALRHPAQHEEGRGYAVLVEEVEHAMGIRFDAMRQMVPLRCVDYAIHRIGMKILLDVDGERVEHRDVRHCAFGPVYAYTSADRPSR